MGKAVRYFSSESKDDADKTTASKPKGFDKGQRTTTINRIDGQSFTKRKQDIITPTFKTIVASTSVARPFPKHNANKKRKQKPKKKLGPDPFPDKPSVPKEKLRKYSRGAGLNLGPSSSIGQNTVESKGKEEVGPQQAMKVIRTNLHQEKIKRKDEKIQLGLEQAARTEILLCEEPGGIEVGEGESTLMIKQMDIVENTDISSAVKSFSLTLKEYAPYKIDYSLNGRHLLLGGQRGHVATFDWINKKLFCEFSVKEKIRDVKWLHNELLYAVAQKQWTYIYDSKGIEIHCLKQLDEVLALDFLPYHFLLTAGHESGFLSWVDVSVGKIVSHFRAKHGPVSLLTTNPANAVVHCGHENGTVSLWTPTVKKSVASILCHGSALSTLAIDSVGKLMVTGGYDGTLRIWDLRNQFTPLTSVRVGVVTNATFSQRGLLSCGVADQTLIFSEFSQRPKPYLRHVSRGKVSSLQFCPFEDVLGVGNSYGFESILVPGSGEPNFDAFERNPYQSKGQRREAEVKSLLEKIPAELITLDNNLLGEVDTETLVGAIEKKPQHYKKSDIDIKHRKRRKSAKIPAIKNHLLLELKLRKIREEDRSKKLQKNSKKSNPAKKNPLERFANSTNS